jgi:hypothetical protein
LLPLLAFIFGIIANAAFYLGRHWSVPFKVLMDYQAASVAQDADSVLVGPSEVP